MNRFLAIALTVVILAAGLTDLVVLLGKKRAPAKHMSTESINLLKTADDFTFYSLNPDKDYWHEATNTFMGYPILGQVKIGAGRERNDVAEALDRAIANGGRAANCFNPRHGIHVKKGTNTLDCLICFECQQACVGTNWYTMSDDPKALFNQTLKDAGVPLPKD
jgi:hypothetical protein